jgi:hypothetical protein
MDEGARLYDRARPWREGAPRLAEAAEHFNRLLIEHPDLDTGRTLLGRVPLGFCARTGGGSTP